MYSVDPDITAARTLEAAFYRDAAAWHAARSRVFARSWQWIGDLADVAEPASLSPREMLPGLLDEPLLLSRDAEGDLRCLSNVCTHRGNLLVKQACRAQGIRCGYHSRRFDLAGRMTFMPEFQDARDFPTAADNLPQVPFVALANHGFASLDPAAPLAAFVGDATARLSWLPVAQYRLDPARSRDYEVDAHWALYVENYLEGFHVPFVHAGLDQVVDVASCATQLFALSNLQVGLAKEGEAAFDPPEGAPDHGRRNEAQFAWIFPNLMLNVYPWGLSVNLVLPQSPERTRVLFRSYVGDASLTGHGAGAGLDRVEAEDEAIVEAVHHGVHASLYRRGRYSPTRERGVHHFHRRLCEHLAK